MDSGRATSSVEMTPGAGSSVATSVAPRRGWARWAGTAAVALAVGVGVLLRTYGLGRLPGVNGDEAWFAIQVQHLLERAPVEWRTPTDNLLSLVHVALTALFVAVAPPSFGWLRAAPVLSSLVQLALVFLTLRRYFGRFTAGLGLALAALLPVSVAYARFSWEPSHVGMAVALAAYCALSGWAVRSALGFLVLLLAHPTGVFAAPFLVLAHLGAVWREGSRKRALGLSALHVGLLLAALRVLRYTASSERTSVRLPDVLARLTSGSEWVRFGRLYAGLLTGDTTFRYIPGTSLPEWVQGALLLALGALLAVGAVGLVRRPGPRAAGVVLGWLATLLAFAALAGTGAMTPNVERYALVLVVPSLLAVAVLLRELTRRGERPWRAALPVAVVCVAMAGAFVTQYLRFLETTGGASEQTFWTGPDAEPKAQALRIIEMQSAGLRARVVVESWWVHHPMQYLAHGEPMEFVPLGRPVPAADSAFPGGTWWVGFPGGPVEQMLSRAGRGTPLWEAKAGNGRPILRLWRTDAPRP